MKNHIGILMTFVCLVQLNSGQAQALLYNLDPVQFSIIDQNTGDTVISAASRVTAHQNLRIQKTGTLGYINLRAIDNPQIVLRDAEDNKNVEILSNFNGSGALKLKHHDNAGVEIGKIELISNYSQTDDSRIITDELEIKGGSDLAELFEITGEPSELSPGSLVSLDPGNAGKLQISNKAYDPHVAGVISGANGVKPGILMGQVGTLAHGEELVTISGRTYVKCNNSNGPIEIGDLLTSSNTQGEAMKATKKRKRIGAVIGKAMSPLDEEEGFVLVLVNLH